MDTPPSYNAEKETESLEKGATREYVVKADSDYNFDAHSIDRVQRRLKQRHVQMIAVGLKCHLHPFILY